MRDLYIRGVDLYTTMATQVFGLAEEYCVDGAYDPTHSFKPRSVMKTGVLAFLYGQSEKSFVNKMGVSLEVAQQFFAGMRASFPGLEPFRNKVLADLRRNGYVETLFGRKRRFPNYIRQYERLIQLNRKPWGTLSDAEREERNELWKRCSAAEREAVNCIIQGTSADILKQILIRFDEIAQERDWNVVLSVHDEIFLQVPKEQVTPETIELVNKVMTETVPCSIPLKCDTVINRFWMDEQKPSEWDFDKCCPKEV